jgi:hypothetical protein
VQHLPRREAKDDRLQDGHICDDCAETTRDGRDNTSRALKAQRRADQLRVDMLADKASRMSDEALAYASTGEQLMAADVAEVVGSPAMGSGGEVINPKVGGLVNTLTNPTIAALEASNNRTDLVTMLGNDIAATALDAADTIQAENSLEKMLAHQMAAIHHASMNMLHRASLTEEPALAAKTLTTALKGFATYQGAIGALRQLRGNQQQHIVVQHVNVSAGGQAVVGNVRAGGSQS